MAPRQCETAKYSYWLRCRNNGIAYRYPDGAEYILCTDCGRVAVAFGAIKVETKKEGEK